MQIKDKFLCHWDFVRFISEKHLMKDDGTFLTLSVTDGEKWEFLIFLGKDDSNSNYEVRVYKNKVTDKYVPYDSDQVLYYEELDDYATFFFENFDKAKSFVDRLGYFHEEYRVRPFRKIEVN